VIDTVCENASKKKNCNKSKTNKYLLNFSQLFALKIDFSVKIDFIA